MASVAGRIKRIFESTKADVVLLMNTNSQDSNFTYLTRFTGGAFEQTPLIVTRKKLILPVSILEYEIAREQRPDEMEVIKINDRKQMKEVLSGYIKGKTVGINGSFLPYLYYKRIKKYSPKKLIDASDAFYKARAVKDRYEILNIRIANKIAKNAIFEVRHNLKAGMTEKQVAAEIDYKMMRQGAGGSAFKSIVSFDKNTALPHHMPDGTRLKNNSIVLFDIGAKYNNYCSDLTRTFMFNPDERSQKYKRFIEMYKIVMEAQRASYRTIREGVYGSKAHNTASELINSAANGRYKGKFIHSLGHPIGIDAHDCGPGLYPSSKEKLKANMIVSDEPGIYVVGFGGVRIEDDVLVTKDGAIII